MLGEIGDARKGQWATTLGGLRGVVYGGDIGFVRVAKLRFGTWRHAEDKEHDTVCVLGEMAAQAVIGDIIKDLGLSG